MKAGYVIDTVDKLIPNEFDREEKLRWLNQLESEIWHSLLCHYAENLIKVCYKKKETSFENVKEYEWEKIDFTEHKTSNGIVYKDKQGNTISGDNYKIVLEPKPYEEVNGNSDLLAPDMFSELYVQKLISNIYLMREETTKYNNTVNIFNQQMYEFRAWYNRNHTRISNSIKNFVAWGDV